MKKNLILGFVFFSMIILIGCSSLSSRVKDNMSDIRYNIFEGACDEFYANLSVGLREDPYDYDGVSNELVECGVLSVVFEDESIIDDSIPFVLKVGETSYSKSLIKNPYENCYMFDIGVNVDENESLSINVDDKSIDLVCISKDWKVDKDSAIKKGKEKLKNKLEENIKNGNLLGECYLKIIYDKTKEFKMYFWSFSFMNEEGESHSCVIDPISGDVLVCN